jgi:hypothetical protein
MRWHISHALQHPNMKRWRSLSQHEFNAIEAHALIGVGAVLVVGMLMSFIAWHFW